MHSLRPKINGVFRKQKWSSLKGIQSFIPEHVNLLFICSHQWCLSGLSSAAQGWEQKPILIFQGVFFEAANNFLFVNTWSCQPSLYAPVKNHLRWLFLRKQYIKMANDLWTCSQWRRSWLSITFTAFLISQNGTISHLVILNKPGH